MLHEILNRITCVSHFALDVRSRPCLCVIFMLTLGLLERTPSDASLLEVVDKIKLG